MIKPVSTSDAFDREAFERAIAEGIAAADAGRLVPHDVVRRWLVDLAEGKDATPPSLDPAPSGS